MDSPAVTALIYYPVKGCAGTAVRTARMTPTGLVHDRSFMLVDGAGLFMSQRTHPAMALIRPSISEDGALLTLSAPDVDGCTLDTIPEGVRREVSLFERWYVGVDQGDAVAAWFEALLGQPCRLVRVPPDHDRDTEGFTPGKAGFADGHAVLIASDASLAHLNDRIRERGADPVPMDRFRPNIVISGWTRPHTEDRVRRMSIGEVEIGYAKRCGRCTVPMVEQTTGRRAGPEPIRTLADYRRESDGRVSFGMKGAVLRGGALSVGDPVRVCAWEP